MLKEEQIRGMMESHIANKPNPQNIIKLCQGKYGLKSYPEYWMGYWEGVTWAYKRILEEVK